MLARVVCLPAPTQAVLKCAACVGDTFDAELLAAVLERPLPEITSALHAAERDGLQRLDADAGRVADGTGAPAHPRWR